MATYINWLDSITHNDEAPGSSPGVATQPWQGMLKLIQLDFRVMGEVNATVAHESVLL